MKKTMAVIMCAGTVMLFTKTHAQNVPAPSTSASSADAIGRTTFGIRAGVNFTNINGKYANDSKMKNDMIPGFNVGINAEIPIAPAFFIQPGVLFTTKGAKMEKLSSAPAYDVTTRLSYIEIPLNFVYKPLLGTGRLIAGLGPYVDFGIAGNLKYDGTGAPGADTKVKFQNTVSTSDNGSYFRKMGAGANLLFGYEFANKLSFQLNAQLGLTDIRPKFSGENDTNAKATHTGFGISAGYRF